LVCKLGRRKKAAGPSKPLGNLTSLAESNNKVHLRRMTSSSNAIGDHKETLAALLGAVDAIFWPMRTADKLAQVRQLRRRYLQAGLSWSGSSGGGSARAWKSDQRLRESMASAGLVKLTRTKSNLPLVKLTAETEHSTPIDSTNADTRDQPRKAGRMSLLANPC